MDRALIVYNGPYESFKNRSNVMMKWTKPIVIKLDIAETLRGSGPCPDGDGGSEAM